MATKTKWTEEDKLKALAIAEASSIREASKQTGIPKSTISRWINGTKDGTDGTTGQSGQDRVPKKVEQIAEQAIEEAKESVREYVEDRVKQVADGLLELVEAAKAEALRLIHSGQDPNDSKAQWLKAVIGAIAQGTEKHQLLVGKPTQRQAVSGEVTTKHEQHYHIIQRVVAEDEDLADRLLEEFERR